MFLLFYVTAIVVLAFIQAEWCNSVTYIAMTTSIIIFCIACLKIRHTIKSMSNPFPNECFIIVHLGNFIIYTILSVLSTTLVMFSNNAEGGSDPQLRDLRQMYWSVIGSNLQYAFGVYLDCFVLYLILRFTNETADKTKDNVLGKEVPSVVFVQN